MRNPLDYVPHSPKLWSAVVLCVIAVGLVGHQIHVHRQHLSYLNTPLGCREIEGVIESGFHFQEESEASPFRWTNGNAKLLVPINTRHPPERLWVKVAAIRPKMDPVRLEILIDGVVLYEGAVPPGEWETSIDLLGRRFGDAALVELRSDVFVPRGVMDKGKNTDQRTLGVQVKGVKLLRGDN